MLHDPSEYHDPKQTMIKALLYICPTTHATGTNPIGLSRPTTHAIGTNPINLSRHIPNLLSKSL